jgi:hypothetical protein
MGNWYRVSGVPLQDSTTSGEAKYVIDFVNGWTLDFGNQHTCRDWINYGTGREPSEFLPATAPQICALVETLEQNQKHSQFGKLIEGVRASFPVSTQFATASFVQYLPKTDTVHHLHADRDYKIEEDIAGDAEYLTHPSPDLIKRCKALFGTRSTARLNAALRWLTGKDVALVPREKTPTYETRFVTFGNREGFERADHYMIDADCKSDTNLNAIAFRIVEQLK